jgi:quercetin dioxygenase-like cupin family protein
MRNPQHSCWSALVKLLVAANHRLARDRGPDWMPLLRTTVSVLILLTGAVWLGYPLVKSSRTQPKSVGYRVMTQTTYQGKNFVIRDTTIEPGGSTGWHWHRGAVIAIVKEGILHHYRSDCTVDAVYRPGDLFVEPSGPDHVHDGRNLGSTPVVLEGMFIVPEGTPLADASSPPSQCR